MSKPFQIRPLDPGEYALWDRFVLQAPQGSLYFSTAWAEILKTVTGRDFRILVSIANETIRSGILYWPKKAGGIRAITQAALTPYQGILLTADSSQKPSSMAAARHEISGQILAYLQNHFDYIDFTLPPGNDDIRPYLWRGFKEETRYTYRFPILPADDLSKQYSQALRRKIKKYRKEGLRLEESNKLQPLVDFIFESYGLHGIKPPLPRPQMEQVFGAMLKQKLGRIFYLFQDKIPGAGILVGLDEGHLFSFFAGMSAPFRAQFDSEYLYSEILSLPEFEGRTFDFLGANTPEFEQFKRSFGGALHSSYRLIYQKNIWIKALSALRRKQHLLNRKSYGNT